MWQEAKVSLLLDFTVQYRGKSSGIVRTCTALAEIQLWVSTELV